MASSYEKFWEHRSFAVVGHTGKRNFPHLTYQALRNAGKKVVAVDPSVTEIDGDPVCRDFTSLPPGVEAAVLEVPRDETREWLSRAADAGIREVWIHMGRETPEALALAREKGLNVLSGSCAVMYLTPGFTYHSIHKWIMKLVGKY